MAVQIKFSEMKKCKLCGTLVPDARPIKKGGNLFCVPCIKEFERRSKKKSNPAIAKLKKRLKK